MSCFSILLLLNYLQAPLDDNNIILMDQLKEYKKIVQIKCLSIPEGHNNNYNFEVKLQQLKPHSLFKFTVTKTKAQVIRLHQQLQEQIFDFDNPFNSNFFANITKPNANPLELINQSLRECTQRLDILTHHYFISFFSLHIHYPDFTSCLQFEQQKQQKPVNAIKQQFQVVKPWLKEAKQQSVSLKPTASMQKLKEKQEPQFQKMIKMIKQEQEYEISSEQRAIMDFIPIKHYEHQYIIVLEECKKTAKISNYFKSFFSQPKSFGFLSIHKKEQQSFKIKCKVDLQAEPKSFQYNDKTNMVMVLTTVGIFVYLIKMGVLKEALQSFAFIELVDTTAFANNCLFAELYLIRNISPFKLFVYSLKEEKLMQTQYKYQNAQSMCLQQPNSRLYVSDESGIYIYLVNGGLDIKRMFFLRTDESYISMGEKLGYLYCINLSGVLTVVQTKPVQKEQLMSVTTTISIPPNTKRIVGSKSPRIIIGTYKNCIVLIDTKEGPINSYRLKQNSQIKALFYYREGEILMAMTADGLLTTLRISKSIQ